MMISLTTILQSELDKINSSVRLLTSNETTIKMNFDGWAFAEVGNRNIDVCSFVDSEQIQLQLVDREILAGQITTIDLTEIALIIDCWLSKNQTVGQLKKTNQKFHISNKYSDLLTLTVDELLEKRWTSEYERIKKREASFNAELFLAFKKKLFKLFPSFSHDNLWFSNVLELPGENFKSPLIFCNKDTFEIGLTLDNSQSNNSYKTTNIYVAVDKTIELLPTDFEETRNPLTN